MRRIPNIFHFVYGLRKQTERFPLAHYLCLASCWEVNRPERIYFYYHHTPHGRYWDAILPYLTLERVPLKSSIERFQYQDPAIKALRYAHHSDFIRLEKLLERGGVYADMDTLFLRIIPPELFTQSFVIGREGLIQNPKTGLSQESLCNAFLMAEPGAEFASLWLDRMQDEFDGSWSNHSTLLPNRIAAAHPELVHIEPPQTFYSILPTRSGIADLFEAQIAIPDQAVSIHLWEHLWWSVKRSDFSYFHGGLLTEDYVREAASTYAKAARGFLPQGPFPGREFWAERLRPRIIEHGAAAEKLLRATIGIVTYPLVSHFSRKVRARLGLARGYFAHRKAVKRFTARTTMEHALLKQIIEWDEYCVLADGFRNEDVVIDVGAHIGVFSFVCQWAGSRNVHAFEAHPGNFALAQHNLAGLPGISLTFGAVFRSDYSVNRLLHSGPLASNTGAGSVMFGGRLFDYLDPAESNSPGDALEIPAISFDQILDAFDHVRLVKLDCEGSEYPILLTSRQLRKIDRLVGEYHVVPEEKMTLLTHAARIYGHRSYNGETIRKALEANGFTVSITSVDTGLGHFDAVRR